MTRDFAYDIFLSHNSKDKPRVRRLAERLKVAGLRVWLDEWIIKGGDFIALKVDEGLEQSRVLVLCISPNALTSDWVALERSTAIHRDPGNEGRRFIPLLLADCELPDTLRRYKYVDFREETDAAFAEVLVACQPSEAETPIEAKPMLTKEVPKKVLQLDGALAQYKPLATLERKFVAHQKRINAIAISPDGKLAASGSDDETVKIWDLQKEDQVASLRNHDGEVRSVVYTPNGENILTGSDDLSIRVWDSRSFHETAVLVGHKGGIWSLVALSDNAHAISCAWDGRPKRWDLRKRLSQQVIDCKDDSVIAVDKAETILLSGHQDGQIRVWRLDTGECLSVMKGHSSTVNSIKIAPNGKVAVSGADDRTVRIWDLEGGICLGTLEGHGDKVPSVTLSPDGALLASAGYNDYTVRIWDLKSGRCLQVIKQGGNPIITEVVFSPDGHRLFVGTGGGLIYVYCITRDFSPPSKEVARRYVNAKVVLLGEGTVGKTSLAHRLIEDKYVVHDRTHGMNVWRLELPILPDATRECEALLWDLAGQEDYRLIHPLFLQETALALLLVNPQTANPFRETGDWLKMLKCVANEQGHNREATRLLILSQVDVGGPKLSDAKLDQFCKDNGFDGWLLTSALNGKNCSDKENGGQPSKLKQLIVDSIPWDKLPWTVTDPPVLAEIKNAVMAMRSRTDIRLLRFAELAQRLEQALPEEKFGESDVRTAVTLLANHGLARPLKFGDLLLLQPELLNGYAAAIIRAARAHTDEIGCVLEADIYRPDFDFTGVERLKHRADEELLLRALVETFLDHSLCIAEDTPHGRHLVFPSQYRREKDIPRDPDVFVSYTFSGEWQTVWTTLIVRLWYSQEFQRRELWRNAAEFASPKGYTLGLKIDNQQGEGTAKISFYFDKDVQDELKSLFIEYGHRHLARYAVEVSRDRRYVCPECGKPVKDVDAVRERKEAGKNFIICQKCDEKVPFIDFIEQRLKSDPVARKILAMDEVTTRELDTQALEQILIGHMMAIAGEANQIFRPVTMFDHGIDGEVEFKDNDGKASGKRIYIQLKSGHSYIRSRKRDGTEVFDVKDERHLEYWVSQPVDVYLVIRQKDETSGGQVIRWMNVTCYLKDRKDKTSRQIIFQGEKLDMEAVWKVRDRFFR